MLVFHSNRSGTWDIYSMRLDHPEAAGGPVQRLTANAGNNFVYKLAFAPDGQWIVFESNRDGPYKVYKMRPDGSQQTPLAEGRAPGILILQRAGGGILVP